MCFWLQGRGGVCSSAGGWGRTDPWFSTPSSLEHHPGAKLEDRRSSIAIGVSDEEESRDTIRLHEKEEVTLATLPTHHPANPLPWCGLPSYPAKYLIFFCPPLLRRTSCGTISSRACATSGSNGGRHTAKSGISLSHPATANLSASLGCSPWPLSSPKMVLPGWKSHNRT